MAKPARMTRRHFVHAAAGTLLLGGAARAQSPSPADAAWPNRPVRFIVPLAAGGGLDFVARGFIGGLWSHTLFTALAGAGVGYAVVREQRGRALRVGYLGACLAAAWLCHTVWNAPMLSGWRQKLPASSLMRYVFTIHSAATGSV